LNKFLLLVLCYNSAEYIELTLKSIIGNDQTEFDVLIHDDCSTDNSREIVQNFIGNHTDETSRWTLLHSSQNVGVNAGITKCIKGVDYEWIKLLAADDELTQYALVEYRLASMSVSSENAIFSSGMVNIDKMSNITGYSNAPSKLLFSNHFVRHINLYINPLLAPTVMIGRLALLHSLNTTGARNVEDWPILRYGILNGFDFIILSGYLVRYRTHDTSLSDNYKKNDKNLRKHNPIKDDVELLLVENHRLAPGIFSKIGTFTQLKQLRSTTKFEDMTCRILKALNPQYLIYRVIALFS